MEIRINTGDLILAIKHKLEKEYNDELPKNWKKTANKQARQYIQNILNKTDITEYDYINQQEITLKTLNEKEVVLNQIIITIKQADNSKENIRQWDYQAEQLKYFLMNIFRNNNLIAY